MSDFRTYRGFGVSNTTGGLPLAQERIKRGQLFASMSEKFSTSVHAIGQALTFKPTKFWLESIRQMNIQALKEQFDRDGYVVLDNFFDKELMDHLDGLIRKYYGDNPAFQHNDEFLSKSQTDVIPWFPQRQGVHDFDAIENDESLRTLSNAILGDNWYHQYCMVMFSKQGSLGQAWHQDCPPESPARFNLNRLVYTSDIKDETGGQTVVVPGSHRMGLLPAGDPVGTLDDQLVLCPKKGTLVLLHGHTWHRVLPITGAFRVSTNYRAAPAGTPEGITDICVYRNMRYEFSTSSVVEDRST